MHRLLIAVLFSLSLQSCATVFSSNKTHILVESDPIGASISVNGLTLGKTPIDIKIDKRNSLFIEARLDGYRRNTRLVSASIGVGWVIADILLGGFIAVGIDAATDSWSSLDEKYVMVRLFRERK